jgi:hypothetical protein
VSVPVVRAAALVPPPEWALRQRHLIDIMSRAALEYQARYTRADGTLVWRPRWPGMDGSDDGYESFHNWPLLYALGGSAELHERSRFLWDAVTRQFTGYGQIYREFDGYYDWMHHGESSIYFYYFGLADPDREPDRSRALRFAGMYTGDDAEAANWDAARRMIRSPISGSRGPRFVNSWEDWETHRWVLAEYPVPFDDLGVPVTRRSWGDGEVVPMADWKDDAVYAVILKALNERQMRCDVPLNLTSTSLVAHAFLHTGDERYRRWITDYLGAWAERIRKNGGICPDNVGPSGEVGETMGGKWWGGYYGWRWPHGFMTIIEPLTIAAMNACLVTGDQSWLDIPRGQLDAVIGLGKEKDGRLLVPYRHTDEGWTSYRPLSPHHAAQIWYVSQDARDRRRLESIPETRTDWLEVKPGRGKGDDIHFGPWYCYLDGRNPEYPRRILEAQYNEASRRMEAMREDHGDPESWDVHHWQDKNPVHTEALLQLACGGPQIIYHGGLLHVRLRPFDAIARRPGLPEDVGALVSALDGESVTVELANTGVLRERRVVLQAGAFGEHRFTSVEEVGEGGGARQLEGGAVEVVLPPSRAVKLRLGTKRYCSTPSYRMPV